MARQWARFLRRRGRWARTLHDDRTDLPRHGGVLVEAAVRRRWAELGLATLWRARAAGETPFVLLDGPGEAQGALRMAAAANRVRKDIVARLRVMRGEAVEARPGWEVFGLPPEIRALRRIPRDRHVIDPLELRAQCRRDTTRDVERQTAQCQILALATMGLDAYRTSDAAHAGPVLETFADLLERGLVAAHLVPTAWCPTCRTALAAAERDDRTTPTVRADVACAARRVPRELLPGIDLARLSAVVLADPAWLLPTVTALAVDPTARYAVVGDLRDSEDFTYLVRQDHMEAFCQASGMRPIWHREVSGRALLDCTFLHPLVDRELRVVAGVLPEHCHGVAALAPMHDAAAFALAREHDLPLPRLLGPDGVFSRTAGDVAGLGGTAAQDFVLRRLDADGALLTCETVSARVPACWRCGGPTYTQVEPQWFLDLDRVRAQALKLAERVDWQPRWAGRRMAELLRERPAWCVSRRRVWGVPIPALVCEACHEPWLTPAHTREVATLVRDEGLDAWYRRPVEALLPDEHRCPRCGGGRFTRGGDVLDVWFDAACRARVQGGRAALAIEAEDQIRGWLQASLLVAAACDDPAPFRAVRVHGLTRDSTGDGPPIGPALLRHGADAARVWAAETSPHGSLPTGEAALRDAAVTCRHLRTTLRGLLGPAHGLSPDDHAPHGDMSPLDRWVLHRAAGLIDEVGAALESGATPRALAAAARFCRRDVRAVYLPAVGAWLSAAPADSAARRAARSTCAQLADVLARLLAPLTPYLAEEVWQRLLHAEDIASVHLAEWPQAPAAWRDAALASAMTDALAVRDVVRTVLHTARAQGAISGPRAAEVIAYSAGETAKRLEFLSDTLAPLFGVAVVTVAPLVDAPTGAFRGDRPGLAVVVGRAAGAPCPRCGWWREPAGMAPDHALCATCAEAVGDAATRQAA